MKRKTLDISALSNAAVAQPDPVQLAVTPKQHEPTDPKPAAKGTATAGRANKVQIQGYFPEETRRRLKALAGREGRTVEDLLGEAIQELLTRYDG